MPGMKSKKVLSTPWFSVEALAYPKHGITARNPYYRLVEGDGVAILAMTPDEKIIIVRQFRPALNAYSLELPAGGINPGETPLATARRELFEETGYRARTVTALNPHGMYLLAHRSSMKGFSFLAKGCVKDPTFKAKEDIEVLQFTLDEFRKLIFQNKFLQFAGLGTVLLWLWGRQKKF